jgi:hypothetical protein
MSLHRVDPRFVLPHGVRRAVVLDGLEGWRAGLLSAGVEVSEASTDRPPDVVITPGHLVPHALRTRARSIIVEASRERPLRESEYETRRIVLRPTRERPTLALPLDQPQPTAYALESWSVVDRGWKRARLHAAQALLSRGLFPAWASPIVTVATRATGPPAMVAAARELGVPDEAGWFLTFGQGDALSRNAFQLFEPGSQDPSWVLKFARVPGYSKRFDNDERGLRLAHGAGGLIATHAPSLVGRFEVDGVHASLETAAAGRRLRDLLLTPRDRARKVEVIDRIGAWILELGRVTRRPPAALAAERERLRKDVIPRWSELGVRPDLMDALSPLPAVTQHNDLGSWNVVANEGGFVVLDWEDAREAALPLWDLLYFLGDAFLFLDGPATPDQLPTRMARLFAGEARSSPLLFSRIRRAAAELAVPEDAVATLATLCWLSHSLFTDTHNVDLATWTPHDPPRIHGIEGIARAWMTHPALGPSWSVWRR